MLDIKFIRENVEIVKDAIKNKNEKVDLDKILIMDKKKRKLQFNYDNLRAEQNKVSKEIPELKKAKKDTSELISEMGIISKNIKKISNELSEISSELNSELLKIPNIPYPDVPIGKSEDDNKFIKEWGEKKEFSFKPLDHLELNENLHYLDFKRAAKISGSGFSAYVGNGAILERALINFMLDFHIQKHGYKEISLPVIVNRKSMIGTGQLPKLEEDMYLVEQDDFFLVPTAEVSITNFYADEILPYTILPQKFVSYSPCFRREAGSYGKDTKGLQRIHQFNKVEMVRFVQPEYSYETLEEMLMDAEEILQALGLHYRVLNLSTADLSFAAAKTYDIEIWAPGSKKYFEVSSISNFESFQARRASIRFRDVDDKVKYVHTLNGSGVATPRTFIALIENYQNKDGSINIPECLRSYLKGFKEQRILV
jgi:seryl-tRNA synthetase